MLLLPPPQFDSVPVPRFADAPPAIVAPMLPPSPPSPLPYGGVLKMVEGLHADQEVIVAAGIPASPCAGVVSELFPGEPPGLYRCWRNADGKPQFSPHTPPAAAVVPPVVTVQRFVGYPVRGSWWSGCGDWTHLTTGPHAGKFNREWLKTLTWAELQSLHSDDHEGRVKWQNVQR